MHTIENPEGERLPRPDSARPEWPRDLYRVEAPRGDLETLAVALHNGAATVGLPSSNTGLSTSISGAPAGFTAPTWKPHGYQDRGIAWLSEKVSSALFLAPGMGKTSITLASILRLRELGYGKRVLILAPLTVCLTTWLSEPKKWAQFQELKVGLAHGPNRTQVFLDLSYDIVVLNYDGLVWATPLLAKGTKFDVLVCDELTKLKHTTSKRFKLLKPVLKNFTFKWGLTASPTANGLIDLFGQVYVLDEGVRLGRYITHFRAKYFHQEPWDQYSYHITPEKAEQLTRCLTDLAMYMDPKDYLVLPGLLNIVRPVVLKDMGMYKLLRDEFILKTKDIVFVASNAGVLTNKLRQFTGGAMYFSKDAYKELGTEKLDALDELIEELNGEPLVVAYEFTHEAQRIQARHPECKIIRGGMNPKEVQKIVFDWNMGLIPLLLVQPQAGAHGLNLQESGAAICWYSLTYNFEHYTQLIARLYRQGQKAIVRNYVLVAAKTVDEVLVKVLNDKDTTQERVFQALKAYAGEII